MAAPGPDSDDTVRVRPTPKRRAKIAYARLAGGAAVLILAATGVAWSLLPAPPPGIAIDVETEAQIDAAQPCAIKVSRLAPDPDIVVIDFPSLTTQGLMLDRVAALVEKARLPRDKVLDDVALNQAISNCGDTIESYYYGHDYKAADLRRFFDLAAKDGVTLNKNELWLKALLRQLGWLEAGANGAMITVPAAAPPITPRMRAVILHHEISHGAFYTIPAYARYATDFWARLTPGERAEFTGFLGRQGYDMDNANLMLNETQAYLIFTRDPMFFNAAAVGMSQGQMEALRAGYIAGIPVDWLRPMADAALPLGKAFGGMCPAP